MSPARRFRRAFALTHCTLYRLTGGAFGARLHGAPVLILRTIGRRTGRRRQTPLLYLPAGDDYLIVGSNAGLGQHPQWYLNLRERPEVEVQIGRGTSRRRARLTGAAEREALWRLVTQQHPGYIEYQERTKRQIPVVVLEPENKMPPPGEADGS